MMEYIILIDAVIPWFYMIVNNDDYNSNYDEAIVIMIII